MENKCKCICHGDIPSYSLECEHCVKDNKSLEERFDREFEHLYDDCTAHGEGQLCCLDPEHKRNSKLKSFIQTLLKEEREKWEKQVLSWYKIPVKHSEEDKIGPIICNVCGGQLWLIRGKHPKDDKRKVCPTCAIEILESIYSNLDSSSEASLLEE